MRDRFRFLSTPAGAAVTGIASGFVMVLAAFLPWFASNLAATTPLSESGWNATAIAKGALALGAIWLILSALVLADQFDAVRLDPRTTEAMGWLVVLCALLAGALVAFRLIRPPEPADLLTRDYGLLVAIIAAVVGIVAGVAQAARR